MASEPPPLDQTLSLATTREESGNELPITPVSNIPPIPGFAIERELGRGGMGVVYKARQSGLNRVVALKMVLGGDRASPQELARFLAEAEAVAAIRHPNVVQVYEYGEHAGRPFFAMEYVDGGTLAEQLRSPDLFSPRNAAELVLQVARGVAAAHALGIVHRDLKPGNILLVREEGGKLQDDGQGGRDTLPMPTAFQPKVSDFGLAKRPEAADLTRTGAVIGTPAYMAPEQAAGRTKFAGPQADVYALGVILFECLTGRPPFEAEDTVSLLLKVVEDEPPSIRQLVPECPRDLESVCQKCLAKDPNVRYPTAAELADDLRRFLDGEPVAARTTGLFGRMVGALDRSLKDAEFAEYSSVMFGFAAVTVLCDGVVTLAGLGWLSHTVAIVSQYGRLWLYLMILWWFRKGHLLPRTAGERQLWSAVGGYTVACTGGAVAMRLNLGWEPDVESQLYQMFAALAALMFFSLGSVFWGWCYALGMVFLGTACLMAADMRFAALMFGGTWAVVLSLIGLRLRRLARNREINRAPSVILPGAR